MLLMNVHLRSNHLAAVVIAAQFLVTTAESQQLPTCNDAPPTVTIDGNGISLPAPCDRSSGTSSFQVVLKTSNGAAADSDVRYYVTATSLGPSGVGTHQHCLERRTNGEGVEYVAEEIDWPQRTVRQMRTGGRADVIHDAFGPNQMRLVLHRSPTEPELQSRMRDSGLLQANENIRQYYTRQQYEGADPTQRNMLLQRLNSTPATPTCSHAALPHLRSRREASNESRSALDRRRSHLRSAISCFIEMINSIDCSRVAAGNAATTLERICARRTAGLSLPSPDDSLAAFQARADELIRWSESLSQPPTLTRISNWNEYVRAVDELGRPSPIATYDLLREEVFPGARPRVHPKTLPVPSRVFEFQYQGGYIGRTDDHFYVSEGDFLFVRVHGVPSGEAVVASVDETQVTQTAAERQLGANLEGQNTGARDQDGTHSLVGAAASAGPRSSLLLRLGRARAGFFRLSLGDAECRYGCHHVPVQGSRWWGIRAGVGFSMSWRDDTTPYLVDQNRYQIVRDSAVDSRPEVEPIIPVAVVLYAVPRQLMRTTFDFGFAAGLDVLQPHRRWFAGIHLGAGPVGLLLAVHLERYQASSAPDGALIASESFPDLAAFGNEERLGFGIGISTTFDFDVFKRLATEIRMMRNPSLSGGNP